MIDISKISSSIEYYKYILHLQTLIEDKNKSRKSKLILKSFLKKMEENSIHNDNILKKYLICLEKGMDCDILLYYYMQKIFEEGLNKFNNDLTIAISYIYFLIKRLRKKKKAFLLYKSIDKNIYSIDKLFNIYRCQKILDKLMTGFDGKDKENIESVDIKKIFNYKDKVNQFIDLLNKISLLYYDFWVTLFSNNCEGKDEFKALNELGSKINELINPIEQSFNLIYHIKNDDIEVIKLYLGYVKNILNNNEKVEEYQHILTNIPKDFIETKQIDYSSFDLNSLHDEKKEVEYFIIGSSEDKSQSIINMHQTMENNKLIDNNNSNLILKNGIEVKKENNYIINNNENKYNFIQNKNNKRENCSKSDIEEKEKKKENNENNNGNNKDLSALQISLSNLLSDIDSKELFFNQNNKNKNSLRQNTLIDISNENINSSLSNNNTNNNININIKNKNQQNDEQSSAFSVCNYSQSLYTSTNNPINGKNNIIINANTSINNNNMIFAIGNNYINNSNTCKKNNMRNPLQFNKEQNINLFINNSNKPINELRINKNENIKIISPYRQKYQIEKGENIELSISDNFNQNKYYKESVIFNYNKKNNLSINKEQNFSINNISNKSNSIIESKNHIGYNINEYYDYLKKNNTASLEIIKEQIKDKQNNIINNFNHQGIKNKQKLINNKNIDIQKEDSKKFFYNPKLNNNSNRILYMNKTNNNNYPKYNKTDYNLKFNNKTEISDLIMETFPNNNNNNRVQKLIITKKIQNDKKPGNIINNKNKPNIYYNISYNYNNTKNNKSYNRKNTSTNINTNININKISNGSNANIKKEEPKNNCKKLFYIKKNRKIISSNNSHNNSSNKKTPIMKIKKNTRNIELSDIDKKKNYSITYNKRNYESRSKSKSKSKANEKNIKNECITEPSKQNNKKKYFHDSHKNTSNMTNDLINQIKNSQKKATNKLLNKLNNINSNNNININLFNQGALLPLLSKIFDKTTENSTEKRKLNKNGINTNKNSHSINKRNNSKGGKTSNKQKNLSENINNKKEKKNDKNNPHKKINTQINILSLLNNFNSKEKNRKNNKSLYNFGNIFFINQSQTIKNGDNYLMSSNNLYEKSLGLNKEKIIIINDNYDLNLNTLNYSNIKQKPQIINDFSNYKKKGNNNIDNGSIIIKNSETLFKQKRFDTDINFKSKINLNKKNKFKDSFKLKKIEGDSGNDIIKGIQFE